MRQRIDLGGKWDFITEGGTVEKRAVPSSHQWMGKYTYRREFKASPSVGRRMLLYFDGLANEGTLFLNGTVLGELEPYVEYRFDITSLLRQDINILELRMADVGAHFAAYNGWSHYAGICRPVYLLEVPDCYIDDVYFHYTFSDSYKIASCVLEISLAGNKTEDFTLLAHIADGTGNTVAQVRGNQGILSFEVKYPKLWSPDMPALYYLTVNLEQSGKVIDEICMQIGFKEFEIRGSQFFLNGKPIFLFGVCRHDLQGDADGFTQSDEQIEQDMRMIKETGANYVRLVHYPHDKRVLDWADRLGLLVSGEPGFWWSNLSDGEIVARGREIMRRLVLRDRSRVSVAFWLAFNECVLNPSFIQDMVQTIRSADSIRPVSGANCMDIFSTRSLFDDNGFDFYTYHAYGPDPGVVTGGVSEEYKWKEGWKSLEEIAGYLCDKPLVFTEWGGYYVQGNPALFQRFCEKIHELGQAGKLAGAAFWVWADYYEYNRSRPSNIDGVTVEGLVEIDRRPREILSLFSRAAKGLKGPKKPGNITVFSVGEAGRTYFPLPIGNLHGTPEQDRAWQAAQKLVEETVEHRRGRIHVLHIPGVHLKNGPALPKDIQTLGFLPVQIPTGRPVLVNRESGTVFLSINANNLSALYVIGQSSYIYGYPADGLYGEILGEYRLQYADGTTQTVPLRNGIEVVTAHQIYINTLIEPVAQCAEKAFEICYDPSFERYRINAMRIPLRTDSPLISFAAVSQHPLANLLIYGITAELEDR